MKKVWIPAAIALIVTAIVFVAVNARKAKMILPDLESEE